MTSYIEKDALNGASFDSPPAHPDHTHEVKSFIATPRMDTTLWERFKGLFKSELHPGVFIRQKDGLRYMFIVTSNSYKDRDDETITSKALEAYEASCYPGEGLFHCDNPLLFWHDDDIPMGEIVAVNYSEPFLVEIAKELPTRTAKILWDYAEEQGDQAGASHRFGYRDEDRQADGTFTRIFKQESSYLPERELAANLGTYAGVMNKMSNPQSDARINQIFEKVTGVKDAASKIHAKTGELEKELAAAGIQHKAAKADDPEPEEPKLDEDGNPIPEEKEDVTLPDDFMAKLQQLNAFYQMMLDLVSAQDMLQTDVGTALDGTAELAKAFAAQKLAEKAKTEGLEQRVKMLEARLSMQPKSVQRDAPATDIDKLTASLAQAEKEAENANLVPSILGNVKPSPYSTRNGS